MKKEELLEIREKLDGELEALEKIFEEAFDLIEAIREYSQNMPHDLRDGIDIFLKKHSERIYGIEDYLNQ